MSETASVPCFVCGKWLDRVHDSPMQPYGGVMCRTSGNYGSRVLDSFVSGAEVVMFIVCDGCLTERRGRTRLAVTKRITPEVTYTAWPPVSAADGTTSE